MSGYSEQEKYWIWLSSLPQVGPVRFYELLAHFEDAQTVYENIGSIKGLCLRSIGGPTAEEIIKSANGAYLDDVLAALDKSGLHVLTRIGGQYPKILEEIDNPPPVLYFKGRLPRVLEKTCGMVGTRKPTKKGFERARGTAMQLARQGVTIISGMARGVDTAAHMGALDADTPTIAVLGCGADVIYPPENDVLYGNIIENGAVLSEFFPGTQPRSQYFPQRNRIIAGLSRALIVGEGGKKSGARITVDYALSYGRDVYTLACDLNSAVSDLPLYLIDAGAPVLSNPADLLMDMGWEARPIVQQPGEGQSHKKLDLLEEQIYNLLLAEALHAE